tara:strand:+ start:325 stop:492 length:168 start_codon:yes stop_codon:yes gene_type:complete
MNNKEIFLVFWLIVILCFAFGCILQCLFDVKDKMKEEDKNEIHVEPPTQDCNTVP